MEYEQIEEEVKAENLRNHEREEAAAKRNHELDKMKAGREGVSPEDFTALMILNAILVSIMFSIVGFQCGVSDARETHRKVRDVQSELERCVNREAKTSDVIQACVGSK